MAAGRLSPKGASKIGENWASGPVRSLNAQTTTNRPNAFQAPSTQWRLEAFGTHPGRMAPWKIYFIWGDPTDKSDTFVQLYPHFVGTFPRPSFYFVGHRSPVSGVNPGEFPSDSSDLRTRSVYLLKLMSISVAFSQRFWGIACVNCRFLGSELVLSLLGELDENWIWRILPRRPEIRDSGMTQNYVTQFSPVHPGTHCRPSAPHFAE